jgi:hypothetical protein
LSSNFDVIDTVIFEEVDLLIALDTDESPLLKRRCN